MAPEEPTNNSTSCSCLVTLTAPNSFEALDQALVDVVSLIYPGSQIYLYKGAYKKSGKTNKLAACSGSEDTRQWPHCRIVAITAEHNRIPISSLVINCTAPVTEHPLLNCAIEIYKNQIQHITQASLDKLTGLLTRDLFELYLQHIYKNMRQEHRRNTDNPKQYAVAFIDVDDFKKVNDLYGHLIGDEVLLLVSQLMKRTFRSDDLLFRFGGEEFIIILNNCDLKISHKVLERFRKEIAEHQFPLIKNITVSIGYAAIDSECSYDTLISRADKALYYAKANGKNKSCGYEKLIEKKLIDPLSETGSEFEIF